MLIISRLCSLTMKTSNASTSKSSSKSHPGKQSKCAKRKKTKATGTTDGSRKRGATKVTSRTARESASNSQSTPPPTKGGSSFKTPPRKPTTVSSASSQRSTATTTTPSSSSTLRSSSSTQSKRNVSKLSGLQLSSPPTIAKKPKQSRSNSSGDISLCDTVNLDEAMAISWGSKEGIDKALHHHFNKEEYEDLSRHEQIVLLCNRFPPADLRPVYACLCVDMGRDRRSLKLNKFRSVKVLAPEIAKVCVDRANMDEDMEVTPGIPKEIGGVNRDRA